MEVVAPISSDYLRFLSKLRPLSLSRISHKYHCHSNGPSADQSHHGASEIVVLNALLVVIVDSLLRPFNAMFFCLFFCGVILLYGNSTQYREKWNGWRLIRRTRGVKEIRGIRKRIEIEKIKSKYEKIKDDYINMDEKTTKNNEI